MDFPKNTNPPGANGKHKAAVLLVCTLLSSAVVLPFFFMGKAEGGRRWWWNQPSVRTETSSAGVPRMPATHDMPQHFGQMQSFYRGLQAGEIYPRWEEDTNRGFGAPTTIYYPPGVYYLTSGMFALFRNWGTTLADSLLLMMIASGATFYLYARRFFSRGVALFATCAYIVAPYHLIDQYQRGALAELSSFVWMPLVLLFADRLLTVHPLPDDNPSNTAATRRWSLEIPEKAADLAGLALSYAAFIWSHVPTAYQFTLIAAVSLPVLAYSRKNVKGLLLAGFGFAMGLGLSSAYLYPAMLGQSLIHYERVHQLFPYNKSFAFSLEDLGLDSLHDFNALLNASWIIGAAAMLLCGLLLARIRDLPEHRRRAAISWLVMGGLALFLMTPASMPLTGIIPGLESGVYSWRLLSIITLVGALCAGVAAQEAFGHSGSLKAPKSVLAAVSATLILVVGAAFSVTQVILPMASFEAFEPAPQHFNDIIMPRNVPFWAAELPTVEQPAGLLGQKGEISIRRWEPEHRELAVAVKEDDALLVRTFNFPGWTAKVDGREAGIEDFGQVAAIKLDLPAGSHLVALDFLDTRAGRIGKILSLASLLLLVALAAFRSIRRPLERDGLPAYPLSP
jgi:hypothetical protein